MSNTLQSHDFHEPQRSTPGFLVLHHLTSIELVMLSNHLIICHPLLLLPSIFPNIRLFSSESALRIRQSKYWSFSVSISPSSEYSGLIYFRIDRVDLAVQGTLKSLLQHHSSKASVLCCSVFFLVQLSHLYMTPGKTIALTRWTFVGKVMSSLLSIYCHFLFFSLSYLFFFFELLPLVKAMKNLDRILKSRT